MKNIICYCSGGLGNRLRPLISCYSIAKLTNRKLIIYWDHTHPEYDCSSKFNELFENKIDIIEKNDLPLLKDCALYVDMDTAIREEQRSKPELKILGNKYGYLGKNNITLNNINENIIFFSNNYATCIEDKELVKILKPIVSIQNNIDKFTKELGLNKSIIGIHARGTDFACSPQYYINQIQKIYNQDNKQIFFMCSDDSSYENIIMKSFPYNILKKNKTPASHKRNSQEGLEDMYLLSKTNIQIYHPNSTFTEIAKLL